MSRSAARRAFVAAALALLLSACGSLHSFRMAAPGAFGMEKVGAALYVEPEMPREQRDRLVQQIALGRAQVERFYGTLETTPFIAACATPDCSARFGSYGERATAFGDGAIRLSHNGRAAPLVAHEWSHTEVFHRVGGWTKVGRLPRWFDEGLAVAIADEPLHAEANWQEIGRRGLPVPALADLVSREQWTAAIRQYGETLGDVPGNLRVVYTTAGHEVRRWLGCAGTDRALALIAAVRAGEAFEAAHARLGAACGDAAAAGNEAPRENALCVLADTASCR